MWCLTLQKDLPNGEISATSVKTWDYYYFFVRSNEEIVAMISKGDSKAFDVDVLKAFIKLLPDNTEVCVFIDDAMALKRDV